MYIHINILFLIFCFNTIHLSLVYNRLRCDRVQQTCCQVSFFFFSLRFDTPVYQDQIICSLHRSNIVCFKKISVITRDKNSKSEFRSYMGYCSNTVTTGTGTDCKTNNWKVTEICLISNSNISSCIIFSEIITINDFYDVRELN